MSDKLQNLHADISMHLERIAGLFKRGEEVKITLVVRMPLRKDGGVLLSDDNFDLAIAEIQRLRVRGEITGAALAQPTSRRAVFGHTSEDKK